MRPNPPARLLVRSIISCHLAINNCQLLRYCLARLGIRTNTEVTGTGLEEGILLGLRGGLGAEGGSGGLLASSFLGCLVIETGQHNASRG